MRASDPAGPRRHAGPAARRASPRATLHAARLALPCAALLALATGCAGARPDAAGRASDASGPASARDDGLALPGEAHFARVRQLTFGGQNAEAYWSWDDRSLILQVTPAEGGCDRIHVLDVESGAMTQITHEGRQTCAYFLPGDERILYASTHELSPDCPPEPDRSQGYVWPLYEYDVYTADRDGGNVVNITNSPGYDAEATVRADGRIVFTSTRSGDLDLWTMEPDGSDLRRLTHAVGYDGGAFFSQDGTKIVWRASRPEGEEAQRAYLDLLGQGLVRPTRLELWVADADGSNAYQLTNNGKANFAPYFAPDRTSVLFASNLLDARGRQFEIFRVGLDGAGPERITHDDSGFNSFPMFSRDGTRLAFSSNRNGSVPHETNVFVADWVP
jgi:Tol biopolymer transport system component